MSVEIASAYVSLIPTAVGMQAAIGKELAGTTGVAAAAGTKSGSFFSSSFAKVATGAALVKFGQSSLNAASDFQEASQKSSAVFAELGGSVQKWADTSAEAFGQSKTQALEAASDYGNLFQSFGVGLPKAKEMSTTLVQLGSDMASFKNTSVEDALRALESGIAGESEPMRRYGVDLRVTALQQEAFRAGITDSVRALDSKETALAAYSKIMSSTGLIQDDFNRNSKSFANLTKTAAAKTNNLKAAIGQGLIPVASGLLEVFSSGVVPAMTLVAEGFNALPGGVQAGVGAFLGIGAGAIALTKAVGGLSSAFSLLAANPWTLALTAALGLVYVAYRNWDTISAALVTAWNWVHNQAVTIWSAISGFFERWWPYLIGVFLGPLGLISAAIFDNWEVIRSTTVNVWNGINEFLVGVFASIAGGVDRWIVSPIRTVIDVFSTLPAAASMAWNGVLSAVEAVANAIISAINRMRDAAADALGPLGSVMRFGGGLVSGIGGLLEFDTGGVVPGPVGQPRLAVVHSGETILPTHKASFQRSLAVEPIAVGAGAAVSGGGDVHNHFDFRGVTVRDDNDLQAIVRAVNRDKRAQGRVVGGYDSQGLDW